MTTEPKLKNGPLYLISEFIIDYFRYFTIVEWFKIIGEKINPKKLDPNYIYAYNRTSVDLFIILKWLFVLFIMKYHFTNRFLTCFVWYLIVTNIYSYFYHHIWKKEVLNTDGFEIDRIRRRFITLILAVGYSNFCFAYLYRHPYSTYFTWNDNKLSAVKSMWYSISNSLAANYNFVLPNSDFANSVSMIQLLVTFVFVTIILGKSIPQTNSNI